MKKVAALLVSGRSIYKHMAGVEAYDEKRDARTWDAKSPAVAHPQCRCWSKSLAAQAKAPDRKGEMKLATWAVRAIRQSGGIVEQPAGSKVWGAMRMPMPNAGPDKYGGWTCYVEQRWFGYVSRKPTWLYMVGIPKHLVNPPFRMEAQKGSKAGSKQERSRTMPGLAKWLVELATKAKKTGA
jgi:hypothetical protein